MAERTGDNPLQMFVDALCYAAPMEEITRIKFGAVSQPKAVDASPSRRLDVALRNLAAGAASGTRKSKRTLKQCIVNELTKASTGDVTSFAVAKKEEVERIAASAR
jgi:small subunit ribosomal protein S7